MKPERMGRRALLTDGEREALRHPSGRENPYVAVSRVRRKIDEELTDDVAILAEHRPDLLEELREVVCTEAEPIAQDTTPAAIDTDTDAGAEEQRGAADHDADPQGNEADDDLLEDLRAYLDTEGGNPKTSHGRAAAVDVVAHLREAGTAKTGELKTAVYPEYETDWGSERVMWESISRYFDDVPGIKKAGYGEYGYTGDEAVREAIADTYGDSDVYDPTEEF